MSIFGDFFIKIFQKVSNMALFGLFFQSSQPELNSLRLTNWALAVLQGATSLNTTHVFGYLNPQSLDYWESSPSMPQSLAVEPQSRNGMITQEQQFIWSFKISIQSYNAKASFMLLFSHLKKNNSKQTQVKSDLPKNVQQMAKLLIETKYLRSMAFNIFKIFQTDI